MPKLVTPLDFAFHHANRAESALSRTLENFQDRFTNPSAKWVTKAGASTVFHLDLVSPTPAKNQRVVRGRLRSVSSDSRDPARALFHVARIEYAGSRPDIHATIDVTPQDIPAPVPFVRVAVDSNGSISELVVHGVVAAEHQKLIEDAKKHALSQAKIARLLFKPTQKRFE